MDGGIVILDTRNQIVYLNPAAQKITGLRTADIFGKSAATIFSAWHQFFEAGREKMEWKEEVELMKNNGPRNLSVRLSPPLAKKTVLRPPARDSRHHRKTKSRNRTAQKRRDVQVPQ